MSKYEIATIFRADEQSFEAGKKEFLQKLESLGIKVEEEEDLKVRTMSFLIKKQSEGHYVVFHVDAPKNVISLVPKETRLQEHLLRMLTIKK